MSNQGSGKKPSKEAKDTQKFASRLISILSEKSNVFKSDSHWELIFGFIFFFGGIYFIFQMIG